MTQKVLAKESGLGRLLRSNKCVQIAELVCVFGIPLAGLGIIRVLDNRGALFVQGIIAIAMLLMVVAVWIGLRLRGQGISHFGMRSYRGRRGVTLAILQSLGVFLAAIMAFVAGAIVMDWIIGTPHTADLSGYDSLRGNLPLVALTLLSVYVTASFGEEFIYRGFLMTRVAELFGGGKAAWGVALVVSSVVFGFVHFQWGPTGIVQTGFMGFALGLSYLLLRRNLWVTILAHGYLDTMLIAPLYFNGAN